MSAKKRRSAIVPRAVFAAVVTLTSIPACSSHEPSHGRSAELRPVAPPTVPTPPTVASVAAAPRPTPTPPAATLDPLSMPYRPGDLIDAGPPDLGTSTAQTRHRTRRVRVVHPPFAVAATVAVRPPPPYGVAAFTVAARDYRFLGVAAEKE